MEVKVYIRKDTWTPSKPWTADLEMDGNMFRSWMSGFKTKKALMAEVNAVAPNATVIM